LGSLARSPSSSQPAPRASNDDANFVPKATNGDGGASDAGSADATTPTADGGSGEDSSPQQDAGVQPDAGADSGTPVDAATDTAAGDASGPNDGGATDDGGNEAGTDAGAGDASASDAGPSDAGDAGSLPPLLGAWSFDEGTGTASQDLSGNGNAAMLVGGASWGTGHKGGGLVLDGASGYADVGVTLIDTTKSYSVMAWVNLGAFNPSQSWEVFLSEDDKVGSLFTLKLRGDNSSQFDFDLETSDTVSPGFVVAQSKTLASKGVWVHLAGVYDASNSGAAAIYVNGVNEATAAVNQGVLGTVGDFLIGRGRYNNANTSYVLGTIDQVAVYGGPLTGDQVSAIYAAQQ
jgi:hypothetical protein